MTIDAARLADAIEAGSFADVVAACEPHTDAEVGKALSLALTRAHADGVMRITQSIRWLDGPEAKRLPFEEFLAKAEFLLKAHKA